MIFPTISLRIERWKFNKDYGVYVSTLGNFKDRHKRNLPIKIDKGGYCRVWTECPQPWKQAHRLVMLTWKPIPNAEDLTVDHLNHNKRENTIYNLEWVTAEENQRRAAADHINAEVDLKNMSPFSASYPINLFHDNIIGYEVNNVIYKNADEIWSAYGANFSYSPKRQVELNAAIAELYSRKNTSGIKNVGTKNNKITIRIVLKNKESEK